MDLHPLEVLAGGHGMRRPDWGEVESQCNVVAEEGLLATVRILATARDSNANVRGLMQERARRDSASAKRQRRR